MSPFAEICQFLSLSAHPPDMRAEFKGKDQDQRPMFRNIEKVKFIIYQYKLKFNIKELKYEK